MSQTIERSIDQSLLDACSEAAASSPRRRKNLNFHLENDAACHRLLNAIEPDSYVPPHCHAAADKDETIIVLRGRLGAVFFDATGAVTRTYLLTPGGACVGVDIPHGVFHSLVALEPGTVFFESKAGPWYPLAEGERGEWAPLEGTVEASVYLEALRAYFA